MEIFEQYSVGELQGLELPNRNGTSLRDATRLWIPKQPMAQRFFTRSVHSDIDPEPKDAKTARNSPRPKVTRNLWTPQGRPDTTLADAKVPRGVPKDERIPFPQLPESRSLLADMLDGIRSTFDYSVTRTRGLYRDAVAVRTAVLSDPDASRLVRSFARERLHIRGVTEHVMNAVIDVLLAEDWPLSALPDDQLRALLLTRTRERHRTHRPILESRLGRMTITSLSLEVVTSRGQNRLDQIVPGGSDTETEALALGLWEDKRLRSMVGRLTAESRSILEMFARFPRLSWAEAAELAGLDVGRGEQLRRQLRYLAREVSRREKLLGQRAGAEGAR